MLSEVSDPALHVRGQQDAEINVNMAALNYILHAEIGLDRVVSDQPMHSLYKKCARNPQESGAASLHSVDQKDPSSTFPGTIS